ncbi:MULTISPECIES: glycosyltransferase family 9 protein [Aeromonas]|uniref:glycosyltransferase family 9 protein n=1 Tax=Aeromonas TaxID=642 RepID=UPI001CC66B5E|nr:glycosyltransferase family 9 protein [Aeromonas caviae]MCJ7931705.1 lipopolysaccharide heptosyltransferase family protein [Aeromonas sp. LsrichE-8G]MDH0309371.1 lipopolysaccharide heptosyltransferase family protein [Aeromonas caviae]GJA47498.1 LOS biosynthesis enzyme LBGB [Aeromonas caviae]
MIGYLQLLRDRVRRALGILLFDKKMPLGIQGDIKHILVVRWDAKLGDSFISSFFFRELKKLPGNKKVTVITTPALASLYRDCFGVDEVIEINKRPGYGAIGKMVSAIPHVDLVIHLTEGMKMKDLYLLYKLSSTNVASLDDSIGRVNVKLSEATAGMLFQDKYRYLLSLLGAKEVDQKYMIPVAEKGNVTSACDDLILINPFGSTQYKSFSHAKMVELLKTLATEFAAYRFGVLSSPATYAAAEAMLRASAASNVMLLDGVKTIDNAIYCVQQCMAVLSVDTAIVHIAVGLEKPLVAIYPRHGETFNQWLPTSTPRVRILFSDSPGLNADMNNVDDRAVCEALASLLSVTEQAEPLAAE